jgi:hypothetical protein
MPTFGAVHQTGGVPIKVAATHSPDRRTLSVILEGTQCRDRGDGQSRFTALSFDLDIAIDGSGECAIKMDVRGAEAHTHDEAFGLARVQAGKRRLTLTGDSWGDMYGRLEVDATAATVLRVSCLLLANGGGDSNQGECLVEVDSLDLVITG